RKYQNAAPWKSLPPERVSAFITPETVDGVERSQFAVDIWNSCRASCENLIGEPPAKTLKLTLMTLPLSIIWSVPRPLCAAGPGAPREGTTTRAGRLTAACTPGVSLARSCQVRPFIGISSNWRRVMEPPTVGES